MPITSPRQHGFTLLEVMVAVFVLSIGLLGLAHLQLTTLQNTQSADFKTQASILSADIVDRMRANKVAAQAGTYQINLTANPSCPGTSMVAVDLCQWRTNIANHLPSGLGSVACPAFVASSEFVCRITIRWQDVQSGQAANTSYGVRANTTFTMDAAI